MASLVTSVVHGLDDIIETNGDRRVKDWFMMSSPFPTIFIVGSWLYFVKRLGPKLMENRKPFSLKKTLLVYNFLNVLISIYLFHEGMAAGWFGKYSFICQPCDYSDDPDAIRMAHGAYWYYMSKFFELADTVFFVLRKKNNQITTLHLIHHGVMPMSVWIGVRFFPGGHGTFFGLLNTFVHIWMYLYYFLAALGPKVQPYLWWKKYLTTMQIVQFVIIAIHEAQLLFINCDLPKGLAVYIGFHAVLFFFLFQDFYNKSYVQTKGKRKEFDVAGLEVDPDREGIKQSDLYAKNYEHLTKQRVTNQANKEQTRPYADQCKMATGYITDEGLRNRVFIDNNRSNNRE